jgi:hypothetical protein
MRIKDIVPLQQLVDEVSFVRNKKTAAWEIHFSIGGIKHKITKHYPSEEPRTWKSLDYALTVADEAFGHHFEKITLNLKEKS